MKDRRIFCETCKAYIGTAGRVGKRRFCDKCKTERKRAQDKAANARYIARLKEAGKQRPNPYTVLNAKYKASLLEIEKLKKSKNGSHKKDNNIKAYLLKCKKAFISLFRALLNR